MTDSFDELLTRLQGRLTEAAEGATTQTGAGYTLPEVEATATAHDEQISVTMTNNEFTALKIDARAMRLTNDELSAHVLEAFNAALRAFAEKMTETLQNPDQATDFTSLQGDLRDIQNQSVTAMRTYTDSLFEALAQARRLQT